MPGIRFPVEAGHIMMFARGIGDANPIYQDDEFARTTEVGGVIAPPTFVQASAQFDPEYTFRPRPGERWKGSGRNPTGTPGGDSGRGLHAEQHFEYFGVIRPGDVLTVTTTPGRTWEKQGRSGRLMFSESITEYHRQDASLAARARSVSVRTERPATHGRRPE